MKLKIYSILIIVASISGFGINTAKAQYVPISDIYFSTWLINNYPNCMSGNYLDTSCTEIITEDFVGISGINVYDITGIQYFDNLQQLTCISTPLQFLPQLPNSITWLDCSLNQLNSITNFPASLQVLYLSGNNINCFPNFPQGLTQIDISNNPATCLPNHIGAMDAAANALPICAVGDLINNPTGCPSANCNTCVNIPDANFASWINSNYPGFMYGNNLDTSQYYLTTVLSISLYGLQIADLTGIKYFSNLKTLDVSFNLLTTLPTLPNTLKNLNCQHNLISTIGNLPNPLLTLTCGSNELVNIVNLPPNLKTLNCTYSSVTSLPPLPTSLVTLNCDFGDLATVPALHEGLMVLDVTESNVSSFPPLPSTLTHLIFVGSQVTSLPALPDSLLVLWGTSNQLNTLPPLPNKLQQIVVPYNMITSLPTLPNHLWELSVEHNLLTELPALPNTISKLICNDNNLQCLPFLPGWLSNPLNFNISNNPIYCVPNYVNAMSAANLALPYCQSNDTVNNPNGCLPAKGITGIIYTDNNSNCILNGTDPKLQNVKLKFYNPSLNQFGAAYSYINGIYHFPCDSGTNLVLVDTLNKPYQANCSFPGIDSTVVITNSIPLATNVNFDIKCKQGTDIAVQSIASRGAIFPGFEHQLNIIAGDASQWYGLNCAAGISGQIQVAVTGPVTYSGAPNGALTPTINGNVYTYNIANFDSINYTSAFNLFFTTNTTAQSGDQVCVHVEATPLAGDIYPFNNTKDYCYTVVNSYDPNYKEVFPTNVDPGFNDWLTYTIHFQNTGTAPAINIKLIDTLDVNLDAETFEVINYSHFNTVNLTNDVLEFRFPNILLPDSTSDLSGSQGFVQYRIKPVANLPLGTQIENTANIYFDYNAPITTNTTVNNFITTVGGNENVKALHFSIFPNPSTGLFNLSAKANVEIYNIFGELIASMKNTETIDLSIEPNGIYFVKLNDTTVKKLIKK